MLRNTAHLADGLESLGSILGDDYLTLQVDVTVNGLYLQSRQGGLSFRVNGRVAPSGMRVALSGGESDVVWHLEVFDERAHFGFGDVLLSILQLVEVLERLPLDPKQGS